MRFEFNRKILIVMKKEDLKKLVVIIRYVVTFLAGLFSKQIGEGVGLM